MAASAEDYKRVLEQIAERVATDEWGGWTDESGIIEAVGDLIESVGITVPHES